MNITGTGYNQYKKINTQNKGKVNSSQQQSKDPGFKGDVFKSLEYVNRDLVRLINNRKNITFKGPTFVLPHTANFIIDKETNNVTGSVVILKDAEDVNDINSTEFVILKDRTKAQNIESNIIFLEDKASAFNIKGNRICLNNNNCAYDIEGNEEIFLKGNSCAHDIKAPQITLSDNAFANEVNAEKLLNISDKAIINGDITMTDTDNPIVKIIGPNVTIGGGINFPEGSNGKVIFTPDKEGYVADITQVKNKIKNADISVYINGKADLEILPEDFNGQVILTPDKEGYVADITQVKNKIKNADISVCINGKTDLKNNIKFPKYSNGKVILVPDENGHVANIDKNNVINGVINVEAEKLLNISDKAVIDRDITMTGTDNSIVKIIGPNVTIGGDINFPEGSNGKVILVPDEKGQVAGIDKDNVKNGVINVEGRFIKLTGSMEVNNVKTREAYLSNNVKAKKVEGEHITLENNAHADEIISRSYVDLQQDATAGKITAKTVYLEGSPSVNEVNAEKLVKLKSRAKVNGDIKLTGDQEPKVLLSRFSLVEGKIIFPENSKGQVILIPFKRLFNNNLSYYNKIDESKVENGILIKSKDLYPRY